MRLVRGDECGWELVGGVEVGYVEAVLPLTMPTQLSLDWSWMIQHLFLPSSPLLAPSSYTG